jgi:hypothetical protein
MADITISVGEPGRGTRELKFTKPVITIGRSSGCDVRVSGDQVSSQHARLRIYSDHAVVEDQNSTNGLIVDGFQISGSAEVGLNSVIQLGTDGPTLWVTQGLPMLARNSSGGGAAGALGPAKRTDSRTKYYLLAAAAAFLFVFIGGSIMLGSLGLLWWKKTAAASSPIIHSAYDQGRVNDAVGYVLVGWDLEFLSPPKVIQFAHGTAFAVSEAGFLITNNHVVDEPKLADIPKEERAAKKDLVELLEAIELLRSQGKSVPFKCWVAFHGDVWEAQAVYKSPNQDLCVLKIPRRLPYVFSLHRFLPTTENPRDDDSSTEESRALVSPGNPKIERGLNVCVLGFPGGSEKYLGTDEFEEYVKSIDAKDVRTLVKKRDYEYKLKKGIVSNVSKVKGRLWIEHDAVISGGNSGGPLCREDGVVLGVNARGAEAGYGFAFTIGQYEHELSKVIEGLVWAK